VPSQIKKDYRQGYLRFFCAENLPKMDNNLLGEAVGIDAYLKITYAGTTQKTKVVAMKNERVIWNQEMRIPIEMPLREETIKIQLWDWDTLVDEFVCSTELKVANILKYDCESYPGMDDHTDTRMKWINFYGPPLRGSGDAAKLMRRDASKASNWCGRMLVEYFSVSEKYPIFKTISMKEDPAEEPERSSLAQAIGPYLQKRPYKICVEFGSGVCLPSKKEYKIRLSIGPL
jgi:hypothetical protein